MTTNHLDSRPDARGKVRVGAILKALGGRAQWRWWAATAVWLLVAFGSYLMLLARGLQYSVFPASVLTLATPLCLALIWAWGTRFAVSLGHRRGAVFLVTAVASAALVWGNYLAQQVARWLEHRLSGPGSTRVFLSAVPGDSFYTEGFFDPFMATLLLYATPILMGLAVVVASGMRWRLLGAALAAVGAAALLYAPFLIGNLIYSHAADVDAVAGVFASSIPGLYLAICLALLGVAWWAFRKQPV